LQAILIDLDGTLLATSFDTIMEAYTQGIASYFETWISKKRIYQCVNGIH